MNNIRFLTISVIRFCMSIRSCIPQIQRPASPFPPSPSTASNSKSNGSDNARFRIQTVDVIELTWDRIFGVVALLPLSHMGNRGGIRFKIILIEWSHGFTFNHFRFRFFFRPRKAKTFCSWKSYSVFLAGNKRNVERRVTASDACISRRLHPFSIPTFNEYFKPLQIEFVHFEPIFLKKSW